MQTDKVLAHNIQDFIVMENIIMWIIDVAISGVSRIEDKELGEDLKSI